MQGWLNRWKSNILRSIEFPQFIEINLEISVERFVGSVFHTSLSFFDSFGTL
jgi:hypothetical protein